MEYEKNKVTELAESLGRPMNIERYHDFVSELATYFEMAAEAAKDDIERNREEP